MKKSAIHHVVSFSNFLLLTLINFNPRHHTADAFNVETGSSHVTVLATKQKASFFGYSVALQNTGKILVGAPLAVDVSGNKTGAVYSCNIDTNQCPEIQIFDGKSDQMLGSTITALGNYTLVGAPMWVDRLQETRGKITIIKGGNSKVQFGKIPCGGYPGTHVGYGYCEAGFSSSGTTEPSDDNPLFVFGSPGAIRFSGALFAMDARQDVKHTLKLRDGLSSSSYMGYSTSIGRISHPYEPGYMADIVGGAPRGNNLKGIVFVYKVKKNEEISVVTKLDGPADMVGSYFGASVCAVDLNNDGKDDLLIGAPQFAKIQDEGRVYVYMNRPGPKFNGFDQNSFMEGDSQEGARFGSSIANIGDINNDGFNDIAIGAPYGGAGGKGVVFIYNGGRTGFRGNQPQKISASDMPEAGGQGFGISIAGGIDVDNNGYPDLVIGAYKDSKVYVLKTNPVIDLQTRLWSNVRAVPSQKTDQLKCTRSKFSSYNCIEIFLDLKYSDGSAPKTIEIQYTINLDVEKIINKRVVSVETGAFHIRGVEWIKVNEDIRIRKMVAISVSKDLTNPIEITCQYELVQSKDDCFNSPCPVLDQYRSSFDRYQLPYFKECASESLCKPDLSIRSYLRDSSGKVRSRILFGRFDLLTVVTNKGENAYQASMKVKFHEDLQIVGVDVDRQSALWTLTNTPAAKELEFALGNPVRSKQKLNVTVKFDVSISQLPTVSKYEFNLEALAFGEDTNKLDNKETIMAEVAIETCIKILPIARPSVIFSPSDKTTQPPPSSKVTPVNTAISTEAIGTKLTYIFKVKNSGPFPTDKLAVNIEVPVRMKNHDFVYVVYIAVDGVLCKENFNELGYKVESNIESSEQDLQQKEFVIGDQINRKRRTKRDQFSKGCDSVGRNCMKTYTCYIDGIEPNKQSRVTMVTRLWDYNFLKINPENIGVKMSLSFAGPLKEIFRQKSECNCTTTTIVVPVREKVIRKNPETIPWWILLVAIIIALILLAIVVFVLYKCGFFKRNRKKKDEVVDGPTEHSKLNSNGCEVNK